MLLGNSEIATVHMLAAVLGAVARAAMEAVGHLPPAVLTYPAAWGSRRRETLAEAAARAGRRPSWCPSRWAPPAISPTCCAARSRSGPRSRCSTSAAARSTSPSSATTARTRHRVGRHRGPRRPGHRRGAGRPPWPDHRTVPSRRVAALVQPGTTAQREDRRLFWDDVRGAKEMLSRVAVAPVTVPGLDSPRI